MLGPGIGLYKSMKEVSIFKALKKLFIKDTVPEELVKNNLDGEHENIGYLYLKKFFSEKIVEPIKYHILAKQYLARDKKYFNFLSDASKISLELQGGILNDQKSKEFENKSYFKPSILLRKFDDAAKRTDIKMKSIHDYEKLLSSKLI